MTYLSPADYGLIGNNSSVALVSRTGSVDWLCLPNLDSPAHFTAYFGEGQGTGRFQLAPQGEFRSEQRYMERTLVLETAFETPQGRAVLTDWMPLMPDSDGGDCELPMLRRKLEVVEGRIPWMLHCSPRFGYGAHPGIAETRAEGILFRGSPTPGSGELATLFAPGTPLKIDASGLSAIAKFTLDAGESREFLWAWGRRPAQVPLLPLEPTIEAWRKLAHRCPTEGTCPFAGPWHDLLGRSSLVLKALTASFSGAIAEAAATSMPGISRGTRTWDYRYASIREAAMSVQALSNLGFEREARDHFAWLTDLLARDGAEGLQTLYTLDGGRVLMERESGLLGIDTYGAPYGTAGIRAHVTRRFQLDLFGHMMLAAREYLALFGKLPDGMWERLAEIAENVCHVWRRPDHGPWENQSRPEHHVSSKLYCWAALDRAIQIAHTIGQESPPRWGRERDILHRTICEQGFDETQHSFVRAFGDRELDSSLLMIPLLGFLPFDDLRVQGTIAAIQSKLSCGVLLYRNKPGEAMVMPEGAHLHSSLLLVSCLALSGRVEEASDHLAEICSFATPLGLLADQVNPSNGEPTGSFPSSLAHLSLIHAGVCVGHARGRGMPPQGMAFGLKREGAAKAEPAAPPRLLRRKA